MDNALKLLYGQTSWQALIWEISLEQWPLLKESRKEWRDFLPKSPTLIISLQNLALGPSRMSPKSIMGASKEPWCFRSNLRDSEFLTSTPSSMDIFFYSQEEVLLQKGHMVQIKCLLPLRRIYNSCNTILDFLSCRLGNQAAYVEVPVWIWMHWDMDIRIQSSHQASTILAIQKINCKRDQRMGRIQKPFD